MTLEQAILDAARELSPDKQQELLDHAKHLRGQTKQQRAPRKSGRGLWADLNINLSAEEIDEVRREPWKNFPRDDI
ncbi:MAG: DUF2281 domain-containing protein [Acidobacteriia bacterium]|nr:DUF2281 domain-containing protein [Terriglobia bacterium]